MRTFPDFLLFMIEGARCALSGDRPASCIWELTYRCNCRCPICPYWRMASDERQELETAGVRRGLNRIHASGVRFINFSGGEPMLRQDLEDIVGHASRRGFWTSIVTNGSLLDADKVDGLRRAGLDNLFVSLDFADRERHDGMRGMDGLYDRVIGALGVIRRRFMTGHRSAGIMCVVSSRNCDSLEEMARLAAALGVHIVFQVYHDRKTKERSFNPPELSRIVSTLLWLKTKYPNIISSKAYIEGMDGIHGTALPACNAGRKYFGIDPQGYLHPCVDQPPAGHVLSDDLSVLRGEAALDAVRRCAGCWYCFRGEADVSFSPAGTIAKGLQYLSIMVGNRHSWLRGDMQ